MADDENIATNYAKTASGPYGFYFSNLMRKLGDGGKLGLFAAYPDQPDTDITLEQTLQTQVIAGTVNSVVDQILSLRNEIGPFGTLLYTGIDWGNPLLAKKSMELMINKVMPAVNDSIKIEEKNFNKLYGNIT